MTQITSAFLIAGSDRILPSYRHESCDKCVVKEVWLPLTGQWEVDEADEQDRPLKVFCVNCAMASVTRQMVVQILIAQGERWR